MVMGFYTRLPMSWQPTNDPRNIRQTSIRMVSKLDGKAERTMLKVAGALVTEQIMTLTPSGLSSSVSRY